MDGHSLVLCARTGVLAPARKAVVSREKRTRNTIPHSVWACFPCLRLPKSDHKRLAHQDCHPESFGCAQDRLREGSRVRFFASLRMTRLSGRVVKCTNVMCFDLGVSSQESQVPLCHISFVHPLSTGYCFACSLKLCSNALSVVG